MALSWLKQIMHSEKLCLDTGCCLGNLPKLRSIETDPERETVIDRGRQIESLLRESVPFTRLDDDDDASSSLVIILSRRGTAFLTLKPFWCPKTIHIRFGDSTFGLLSMIDERPITNYWYKLNLSLILLLSSYFIYFMCCVFPYTLFYHFCFLWIFSYAHQFSFFHFSTYLSLSLCIPHFLVCIVLSFCLIPPSIDSRKTTFII